jgi:hypothetical protein
MIASAMLGLRPVVLDPHLVAAQIDVDDGAVDAPPALPPDEHQLIVTVRIVGDELHLDVALGRSEPRVLCQHLAHDRRVSARIYHTHRRTSSAIGSNTISRSGNASWSVRPSSEESNDSYTAAGTASTSERPGWLLRKSVS